MKKYYILMKDKTNGKESYITGTNIEPMLFSATSKQKAIEKAKNWYIKYFEFCNDGGEWIINKFKDYTWDALNSNEYGFR